ncbi:BamA/TamA family outer membrane protein [soil metagenome]
MRSAFYLILVLTCITSWGCKVTNRLPAGEKLYTGAELEYVNKDLVEKPKSTASEITDRAQPQPNRKFLGLFYSRLWFYQRTKEPKKVEKNGQTVNKKGLRNFLKYKIGEPPIFITEADANRSKLMMEKYLRERGYFGSEITYDIIEKENTVSVKYFMTSKGRHTIREVILPPDSVTNVNKIIYDNQKYLKTKKGQMYWLQNLTDDRSTLSIAIRDSGYYAFSPDYIFYYVDTTVGETQVDVYFNVAEPDSVTKHRQFFFRNVIIYPGYAVDAPNEGLAGDTVPFRKFTFIYPDTTKYIRLTAVGRNLLTIPDERFSQTKHNHSVSKMLDLGVFKFVNIRYIQVGPDSLDVFIYMTPGNTQTITAEVNASTTTTNFIGTFASVSYANRNILRGAEEMRLTLSGGIETQIAKSAASFINTIQLNSSWEFSVPRFVVPWGIVANRAVQFTPRTRFGVSYNFQSRYQFFSLSSFGAHITYDWRPDVKQRHQFSPLFVERIRTLNIAPQFQDILDENPVLRSSFTDVFIIGFRHIYNFYNPNPKRPLDNYWYFNGDMQLAGNFFYLFGKLAQGTPDGQVQLTGVPVAQYFRIETDTRYYDVISRKTQWVNRIIAGIAVPYGNIETTPYIKQFFSGGSVGMRAFRFRALGPGSYDGNNSTSVYPDQTGDIKLEWNTELRHTIYKFLKGAVFMDVGNIWLLKDDPQRPGGQFSKNFYKEFAIGAGYGIRLDFTFVIIRLDVAMPIRKPSLPEGDRWTFNKMNWREGDWRKDNLIFNIAIGYPF